MRQTDKKETEQKIKAMKAEADLGLLQHPKWSAL